MKSLTRVVLFVLCVQSVCCYSSETWFDFFIQTIEGSPTIEELNRIFYKCDMSQMQDMFERNPRIFCLDQSTISKRDTDLTEIKRNLKQCVDSSYFHVIDSIHKVAHNVLKILCENSDEYVKELIELFENKSMDKNRLFNQLFLQASSCVFSEKEVMNVSKSVDNVLEFYMNLIRGQEKQCGVVKRIQKCTLKNKLNDTEKVFVERLAILLDLFLKAFECKFDDDIDEKTNLDVDFKAPLTLDFFHEKSVEAFSSCDRNNLNFFPNVLNFHIELLTMTPENVLQSYENICEEQFIFDYVYLQSKIEAETLKECIVPSYVQYVDKFSKLIVGEYEYYCSKKNQTMEVATAIFNTNLSICLQQNIFRLAGCFFSAAEVRDVIEDSTLVSNFTMGLLDGNEKECGTIDEINNCMIETIDNKCIDNSLAIILKHTYDAAKNIFGCKVKLCKEFSFKNFNVPFKKC